MKQPFAIVTDTGHNIPTDLKEKLIQRLTWVVNVTREQIVESKIGPSFLVHTGKRAVGVVWEEKG